MFDIDVVKTEYDLQEKLKILADAAKYDVACTSSGVDRKGKKGFLGNSEACGICHSFASDGRCISLLKILMTNHCIYDCKYCINRCSNDIPRATFTPDEICQLTVEFYKRNYIEGLFLSSGVIQNPGYTMEKMCEALMLLRGKYKFNGYIHVKTIPGAPDEILRAIGHFADRISINMELPTEESLSRLAPNKTFSTILDPMEKVSNTIAAHRVVIGKSSKMERSKGNRYLDGSIFNDSQDSAKSIDDNSGGRSYNKSGILLGDKSKEIVTGTSPGLLPMTKDFGELKRPFAPAGQSTQMIIGASGETDLTLIKTTQKLYQDYDLKRVFYSAYIPINEDNALPALGTPVPLLREHRLYQADWLLRYYGFLADELLSEERPNFNDKLDPKCDWALRHISSFPVEVSRASYDVLLRVPGIGPKSAGRIISARRYGRLSFEALKKMGVVLKRAHYFILCNGKQMYKTPIDEAYITRQLISVNSGENWQYSHANSDDSDNGRQLSLFDDFNIE